MMINLPEEVLFKIANRFRSELAITCPVLTGRLRNSLTATTKGNTIIITMSEYGRYVEWGTFKQRPNPFIRNAINNKLGEIIQEEIQRYYG